MGTVSLPADKTEYSTYASDGTTLVKEYCPFSGDIDINGVSIRGQRSFPTTIRWRMPRATLPTRFALFMCTSMHK